MLQVARLAPKLLDEAAGLVATFLKEQFCEDGGARDRFGKSDLYYTAFALEGLAALQADLDPEHTLTYLRSFGNGQELDIIHQACLLRCWTSMPKEQQDEELAKAIIEGVETHRSADGGYAANPGEEKGTLYHAFLALGAYQDAGLTWPEEAGVIASLEAMRSGDGGYANVRGLPEGTVPSTAAAVTVLRYLGRPIPDGVSDWLLAQCHVKGGFLAVPAAPMPDLLSTATALHALACMETPIEPIQERCLDFMDSLWTGKAFTAHWADDEADVEYTWYALLALGHLSL